MSTSLVVEAEKSAEASRGKAPNALEVALKELGFTAKNPYEALSPPIAPPDGGLWHRLDPLGRWVALLCPEDLPRVLVLDIECGEEVKGSGDWIAELAIGLGPGGTWYGWRGSAKVIPFRGDAIVVAKNGLEHDANYLSSSYTAPGSITWIDVEMLACAFYGVPDGAQAIWRRLKSSGNSWASHGSAMGLDSLAKSVLGRSITKGIRAKYPGASLRSLYHHFEPRSFAGYCSQDVEVTHALFRVLGSRFLAQSSPELVRGVLRLGRQTILLSRLDAEEAIEHLTETGRAVLSEAVYEAEELELLEAGRGSPNPDLDRHTLSSGPGKGSMRWQADIRKYKDRRTAIQLLRLQIDGVRPTPEGSKWLGKDGESLGAVFVTLERLKAGRITASSGGWDAVGTKAIAGLTLLRKADAATRYLADLPEYNGLFRVPIGVGHNSARLLEMDLDGLFPLLPACANLTPIDIPTGHIARPTTGLVANGGGFLHERVTGKWHREAQGFAALAVAAGETSEFDVLVFGGNQIYSARAKSGKGAA